MLFLFVFHLFLLYGEMVKNDFDKQFFCCLLADYNATRLVRAATQFILPQFAFHNVTFMASELIPHTQRSRLRHPPFSLFSAVLSVFGAGSASRLTRVVCSPFAFHL